MKTLRLLPLTSLLSALAFAPTPATAQEVVQALPGTTDADALAADMRRLASNPRDVDALVDAARLSLRLEDSRAAAALLARAENVDPGNPKVKAGQGSILVQSERPGQALRYFAQAEAGGLNARAFAADRGLAFDLTGQQERAQRDYRLALRDSPGDDETTRRYALSLGISGQRQRALQLLDPLVRRSDRSAWRAQAFVLAMTGDVGGASRIATTMMPGGAAGLAAFFARLPTLPAIDRAFAVHFGQVRATPERLADARLAPSLSPLPREPAVLLASAQPLPAPRPDRRSRREREVDQRVQLAAIRPTTVPSARTPPPTSNATTVPERMPAVQTAAAITRATSTTVSTQTGGALIPVAPTPQHTTFAQAATALASAPVPAAITPEQTAAALAAVAQTTPSRAASAPRAGTIAALPTSVAASRADVPSTFAAAVATAPGSGLILDGTAFTLQPTPVLPEARAPSGTGAPSQTPAAQPVQMAALPPADVTPPPPRVAVGTRVSEDSILARIVAGLSIPAAELGVEGPERPTPAAAQPPVSIASDAQGSARAETDPASAEKKLGAVRAASATAALVAKAAADKKTADRKAVVDRKALAEKKAAATAKALADKEAAEQKRVERTNPERIWVQVAGGAFERDLPKAYAAVKAKAPAVFGNRSGWTTPLRATNRVLTGPFKTDAEARAFVNDLKKQGVSAFTHTSDAGQPVKKLGDRSSGGR